MPRRIVFVCTGNSCRSPLAEVLARARYADLPLIFASAGTAAVAGQPASAGALEVARERGLDLSGHHSAPLDATVTSGAAWLIGLTRAHAALLRARLSPAWPGRVGLLGEPGRDWRAEGASATDVSGGDGADADVADPWRQDLDTYRRTADHIDRLLAAWADVFRELGDAGSCGR